MCSSNKIKVVFLTILRNFPEHDNLWGEIAINFKNEFLLLSRGGVSVGAVGAIAPIVFDESLIVT